LIEVLSGRLGAPDYEDTTELYNDVDFRWPAWPSLDPSIDADADEVALRTKVKSRAEIIAARGRDIEDVDREIAADPLQAEQDDNNSNNNDNNDPPPRRKANA
jgi:capsid protein